MQTKKQKKSVIFSLFLCQNLKSKAINPLTGQKKNHFSGLSPKKRKKDDFQCNYTDEKTLSRSCKR